MEDKKGKKKRRERSQRERQNKHTPPEWLETWFAPLVMISLSLLIEDGTETSRPYHILPYNVWKMVVKSSWLRMNC